jgi:hypothetical protein
LDEIEHAVQEKQNPASPLPRISKNELRNSVLDGAEGGISAQLTSKNMLYLFGEISKLSWATKIADLRVQRGS